MRIRGLNRNFRRGRPSRSLGAIAGIFASGIRGMWYDTSDLGTMFQDNLGLSPVTAMEQPLGLQLDKSENLALGPELLSTGVVQSVGTSTTATYNTTTGEGSVFRVDANNQSGVYFAAPLDTWYRMQIQVLTVGINIRDGAVNNTVQGTLGVGTFTCYVKSSNAFGTIGFAISTNGSATGTFRILSVRQVAGKHRWMTTASDRPILRNRYNLLTYSQDFTNAIWAKTNASLTSTTLTAPDGTSTATMVSFTGGTTVFLNNSPGFPVLAGDTYTAKLWVRNASISGLAFILARGGTSTYEESLVTIPQSSSWQQITVSRTFVNTHVGLSFRLSSPQQTAATVEVWGAQITHSDFAHLPYQWITTATSYNTDRTLFRPYLAWNGVNTRMQSSLLNFSGTDEITVAGVVQKLSSSEGQVLELSASQLTNNGNFQIRANLNGLPNYMFGSKGTAAALLQTANTFPGGADVLAMVAKISTDSVRAQVDGVEQTPSTVDQGSGNYGNYQVFFGSRGLTTLMANMNTYDVAIFDRALSDGQLAQVRAELSRKAGLL